MIKNENTGFKIFYVINYFILASFILFTTIPFLFIISASITKESEIIRDGYKLIPKELSLEAFSIILGKGSSIFQAYFISISITVIGTFASLLVTSMVAYAIANHNLRHKNKIALFMFFTMLFSGGIVPWYIMCTRYLGLRNNMLALILPMLLNPWYVFLMRNYFRSIPESITESARIDGAQIFTILLKIILPLSKPILATVGLFYTLAYWNDWWLALMLIEKKELAPLQFTLFRILSSAIFAQTDAGKFTSVNQMPTESIKMATTVVTIGPIIFIYPFVQKYFVKGILIGAVKG